MVAISKNSRESYQMSVLLARTKDCCNMTFIIRKGTNMCYTTSRDFNVRVSENLHVLNYDKL